MSLRDAGFLLRKRWRSLLIIPLVTFAATLAICLSLPKRYGYQCLIRMGRIEAVGSQSAGLLDNADNIKEWLTFHFTRNPKRLGAGAELKRVTPTHGSGLISLEVWAASLVEAESACQDIVKELQARYAPQIAAHLELQNGILKEMEKDIAERQEILSKLSLQYPNSPDPSFETLLSLERSRLRQEISSLASRQLQLRSALEPEGTSNFQLDAGKPVSAGPVTPRTTFTTTLATVIGLVVAAALAFLLESTARSRPGGS